MWQQILGGVILTTCTLGSTAWAQAEQGSWPADVKGYVAPAAGEHPRLFIRKNELAALKEKAKTPEGQAIIKRLRITLNGGDGMTMPTAHRAANAPFGDKTSPQEQPVGAYTFSHAAGYGLLYQITGDKKYADLGKTCFEWAFEGIRDRDDKGRYGWKGMSGALRAGPTLGWYAVGYDLCYDGWDDTFRQKVAKEIQNYNQGPNASLPELVKGSRHMPGSNHWGMQVGGGALAVLALMNDPGVDMKTLTPLLDVSQKAMIRNMTEGFGDGGFFAEGDGTGSMSSFIAYLPALQAWRTAGGKDFLTPRPNAQWMTLKWLFLTVPSGKNTMDLRGDFPERGGYPHNIWAREGLSGSGYFTIGFGVVRDEYKPGMLWFYDQHLKAADEKAGAPFDTVSVYPHQAVLSLLNWPMTMKAKNPSECIPHAYRDTKWNFYAWRNRWQDQNDTVISILTRGSKGFMSASGETKLNVWSQGKRQTWGTISGGFKDPYAPKADGSTILTTGDGSCLAVDFSPASGAEAVLIMTGPGAPAGTVVEAGGQKFSFLILGGKDVKPQAQGDKIILGGQTIGFADGKITLAK